MNSISEGILAAVENARVELLKISDEEASRKEKPESWSKKEIVGHLIDSASNNHQRFVRGAQNIAGDFPVYNQNRWVEVEQFNTSEWKNLIELFYYYNWHIANVINSLPDEVLSNECNIGREKPVTLEFVISDYLRHLKHHVEKLLQ